jgi:hypothetical protein
MILTIYDIDFNGKTGKKKYNFIKKKKYSKCILNFKENKRIKYDEIKIINNQLFDLKNNKIIDLINIKVIIFNYGEDNPISKIYVNKCLNIYNFISKNYNNIKIFNNPNNNDIISDTLITYQKLKKCKFIKIPLFFNIKDKNDLNKINDYPAIISKRKQTSGRGKIFINSINELKKVKDLNDIFYSKFYNSYLPETKIFISIRLYIFNNKLIDFSCRPSLNWNVHIFNQINDKNIIIKAEKYFYNYIQNNKTYINNLLNELYEILGNGLYGHDFIINNNKLILTELGYKTLDPSFIKIFSDYNLNDIFSYKISSDYIKVRNTYRKLLLNF